MRGKTLITGGSGFIGTNLIAAMTADGEDLLSLDKAPALCPGHERYRRPCDIMDADVLCEAMRAYAPDRVVHLAARTDLEESEGLAAYRENIQGTTNVLNAIRATPNVKRAVITSSSLASRPGYMPKSDRDYRPHTRYGESKAVSEELTRAAQLPCTWFILRPTTIWGPWLIRHRDEVFKTMRRGLYLHPGGAPVMRAWGYVGNSVHQIRRLLELPHEMVHERVFYIADERRDIADWADVVSRRLRGRDARRVPRGLLRALAFGGDLVKALGGPEILTSARYRNMTEDFPVPIERTLELVGPLPFSLEEGVAATLAWLEAQPADDQPARQKLLRPVA